MKARLCLGIYATKAYHFENLNIDVYCMEELAYCLKEHAFLLGTEIMSDTLLHFISSDCQVPELARELYPMVHQKGSLSVFVSHILEYVGFFDKQDIKSVEDTVRMGSGLSDWEKKKLQADHLLESKKYFAAIEAYEKLITELENQEKEDNKTKDFVADLYYNRGVVFAHMFLYDQAADSFQKSNVYRWEETTLQSFLMAKRMELSEKEYIALAVEYPEFYEASMKVEQKMNALQEEWETSSEYGGLKNLCDWRMNGDNHKYYEECNQIVNAIREDYRNCI